MVTEHQRIKDEHVQLREAVAHLRDTLPPQTSGPIVAWYGSLDTELAEFIEMVERHFALEEEGGYMRELRDEYPRLGHRIDELAAEHASIREALSGCRKEAREGVGATELVEHLHRGLDLLAKHESAETELFQDAMQSDIGAAD